ncbi:MAG TPA: hypothetical protein VFU41_06195 [Gemmatimonadales bacterium]|nr:hypothetical protein [Gemmatimonadales bacterium]
MTTGLIIFGLTYLLIAVQRLPFVHLNRPAASLVGAVAMVVFGVLSLPDAYAAMWRVLAMGSTFAGNLLLIGSMAKLIVAERAETRGVRIGFGEYARSRCR